ncbi:MAG: ExbD/TolR family protein [Planctomycetota bacterium]|jgi:biopolymer transport protein ExbD
MRRILAKLRRDADSGERELPLSMIDVTFLLLIFFLCSMNFKSVERALGAELPKKDGQMIGLPPPDDDDIPIRVKLHWANARGQVIHSPRSAYPEDFQGVRRHVDLGGAHVVVRVGRLGVRDLNELARTLADLAARDSDISVVIDARQAVPFKWVIGALDACARAQVRDVKFQSPPKPGCGGDDWWWL